MPDRPNVQYPFATLATVGIAVVCLLASIQCSSHLKDDSPPLVALDASPGAAVDSVPFETIAAESSQSFERLPAESTGIDFVHYWTPPPKYEEIIDRSFAGGGVAMGDYDRDGRVDVYLSRPFGGGRLYRNLGNFRFEDATDKARLATDTSWACGPSFVDIDNDGDLDLFVCGYDCPNRLFVNQGDGTFVEQAQQRGLAFVGASVMMAFSDYDGDGDMDGFLVTNRFVSNADSRRLNEQMAAGRKFYQRRGNRVEILPDAEELMAVFPMPGGKEVKLIQAGQYSRLYRNRGDGRFDEVSRQAGVIDNGLSLAATWWDYDHDGRPDLYIANDFYGSDRLFHNNGNGTFTDVVKQALPHIPWYSMGCNVADVNNDGLLDFMGSDMSGTTHYKSKMGMGDMSKDNWFMDLSDPQQVMRNALYVNTGTGRFLEVAQMAGMANSDWTWCLKFGDFDCDGLVDLFITNGMTGDWLNSDLLEMANQQHRELRADEVPPKRDRHLAFRNQGDLQFADVSSAWQLGEETVGFGAAMGDLDNDGDLDLVVNNFGEAPSVFRNGLAHGNCVKLHLRGRGSNHYGIDSLVTMEAGELKQAFYLTLSRGFMGSDDPTVHFGLGNHEQVDHLTIRWPSGCVQTLGPLSANRSYTIYEPEGLVESALVSANSTAPPTANQATTMFTRTSGGGASRVRHQETEYDDFQRQPLLPNKLSQLGPGMALADVNGDGAPDLFVGGAAGQEPSLLVSSGGRLAPPPRDLTAPGPFEDDRQCEDMGCLFFDADGDGDRDLYVASGGVECEPGDVVLQDRLYLNDGRGGFTKVADALPDLRDSSGCVVAADFDRDGDLDLFVGGRSVPGQYPLTPNSRILRNDTADGKTAFRDATEAVAPELAKSGMVTAALWSDADNDGWLDLMVTYEWGPVRFFRNQQGQQLVDATREAGLAERLGWWNGIAGRDVDGDGDIDYAVTNFGLNTKYHPTPESPVAIFYGDFEHAGRYQIVEAKKHGDHFLPVRGKSCSQNAMPFLREKFPTYRQFALADLTEIYTPDSLDSALRLEVNCLESGLLVNDGQAHFRFQPFPREAQVSPAFGVQLTDVDGDGQVDVYLAQNFFGPQRETGRMNSGVSALLRGRGDGTFVAVPPQESGLVVPEDAKSLAATDLTGDGRADFVVGTNNDQLIVLENRTTSGDTLQVALRAPRREYLVAGARIDVTLDDGTRQMAEVYCGESYLTQTPATIAFGVGNLRATSLAVRWSDGQETVRTLNGGAQQPIVLQRD